MSDDELPMTGEGMGDLQMADMENMEGMSDGEEEVDLPEGVKKEIIQEAPEGNYNLPKTGDEVTVHYVGTLQSDGSQFDSSRSREQPFKFTLGQGEVIKGWDLGVATMKKGEVAKFTLSPEYAYGDAGSPPSIPEKATLVFEVELIDWLSKDDLFSDGGVIKLQLTEGSGWKSPQDGEVKISLKASQLNGDLIDDKGSFEYVMGSDQLGPLATTVEKALQNMKRGEHCTLTCTKHYAYGDTYPDGAVLDLTLEEIYEVTDVSPGKDKSLMKKQVKEGSGYEKPKDSVPVTLRVEQATDGHGQPIPSFIAESLSFTAGNGAVCDALEFAVQQMKKGERAVVTSAAHLCREPKLGLAEVEAEKVILTMELMDFEELKGTWEMSQEEKLEHGAARKDVGAELFKSKRYRLALQCYKRVADLFGYIDNYKEENKAKAEEMKMACTLNQAACELKLELYAEAKLSCDTVLKQAANHVKALFRHAQADFGLKNYLDCIKDLKRLLEIEPQNREARALTKQALAQQKEEDQKSKNLYGKMCQALGKSKKLEGVPEKASGEEASTAEFESAAAAGA
ncbi:unnamed protein product [Durusdinium trenchii]|uniref:peptidylprolyl isomerase n=1 Tax=Durusdinium trenchii TaxID=1381693 RepID=A0ABP0J0U3_9DINO